MSVSKQQMNAHLSMVEQLLQDGAPLEIGAADLGNGPRVMMGAGGKMLAMGVKEARRIADVFDAPAARQAGLTVAEDLRAAADAVEAHGATRQ